MSETNSEIYPQMLVYLKRGFSVIPVGKDKKPMLSWEQYQKQRPTEDEIAQWCLEKNPAGVAIITGAISGIVVLDVEVDGDTSGLDIPTTPTAKTGGGGRHYFFKHPEHPVKNRVRIDGRKMDLRGDGGYVVAPPSRSVKGQYEWLVGLDTPFAEMPVWLEEKKDTKKPMLVGGIPVETDWSSRMRGVAEGGRHDAAVRIAGKLLAHIPRKDREGIVLPLLEAWNEQNIPPLDSDELYQIFDDISERHDKGKPTELAPRERKLLTVADLLAYNPATYPFLVDPIVPHRGITALGGQPGVGKSWVVLEIARSVASGTPLFGKFPTLKGNVLIIDEESGMDEMLRRAKMLNFSEELPIFFHVVCGFKLDKENDLAQLVSTVKKKEISLVILDPYIGVHNKSENSAEETAMVMEAMQQFIEAGAAVLYIHHLRKDSVAKFGNAQALRGSSVLLGRLDSLIIAKSVTSDAVATEIQLLHEKARRGKKLPPLQLTLTEENGKMIVTDVANVEPAKRKIEEAQEEITTTLLLGGEMSRKDIMAVVKEAIQIGDKNVSDALRALVENKRIVEVRQGKEKHYSLPREQGQ